MAQRLSELLSSLPAMRQARALGTLQRHLDAVLPQRFRGETKVVALEDKEMRVLCSNGAIASRLRLEAQNLADALQKRGVPVHRISFKVQPTNSRKTVPSKSKPPLSPTARQAFQTASEEMEEGEVKTALQALLKHHQDS